MLLRFTAFACGLVLLAAVATAAFAEGQRRAPVPFGAGAATAVDVDVVDEIIDRLDANAVDVPDDDKLVRGAIDGLLEASGDPYAAYYDERQFDAFNEMLDGEFSGVGLEVQQKGKQILVVRVLEGTPAERAGIEPGERIVSVDGTKTRGKPIDVVVGMIKGEPGTRVTLGLAGGSEGRRKVTVERETIDLPSFQARLLEDGHGLIELRQFTSGVGDEVRQATEQLIAEGAQGIVLDLRGNPGGLLPEAIEVASVFIEDGPVVSVQEREGEREVHEARGDALESIPLVVLVDRFSASASEIVAGAVQDAERGQIVGRPTYGKGTVQTIQRLDSGGGLKFTTAKYFTPSGDSIEGRGVKPDLRAVDRERTDEDEALSAAQEQLSDLVAAQS